MEDNKVWKVVDRPYTSDGKKIKTTDSRWVFKRKTNSKSKTNFKARLVRI